MGHWVSSNHNHADEYMGSCLPYVTSSIVESSANDVHKITFPYVTRWVIVHNSEAGGTSKTIKFGFTDNGVRGTETSNYFTLHSGEISPRLEVKCTEIFIGAGHDDTEYSVIAGYTNIPKNRFLNLTGSEGFQGVG